MKTMRNYICAACMITAALLCSCDNKPVELGTYDIIPLPLEINLAEGEDPFIINSSTTIVYPADNVKMENTAKLLASYINEMTGTVVKTSSKKAGKNCIVLSLDDSINVGAGRVPARNETGRVPARNETGRVPARPDHTNDVGAGRVPARENKESYRLTVTKDKVEVTGSTEAAVFLGCQTIHKALPITDINSYGALPAGTVVDEPRFAYRGFLVDVGRHFFSVDYLKELIDVMALHNINHFHWHLTEDQGWRIEIKKYPKLTEIGSVRSETILSPGSNKFDGTPVSGYYTQEEAKEIVEYAAERFITVIPEIDLPGHTLAALASYPELGCTGGPYKIPTRFGIFEEVLCGGNEQTLQFAKDVLNEIMDIFPSEYIHIGGDECPKFVWAKCRKCQAKIRELGLKSTREHSKENQLQAWFMGEIEKEINARGRKMMAWDEILEGNPSKTATVMAWTSPEATNKSAGLGHQTIVCPIQYLYFSNPGYNKIMGEASVQRVYDFEPVPDGLSEEQQANIIGAQGCLWTEWTKDSVKMEWQIMPRISALSELQWTDPKKKDFEGYLQRLRRHVKIYDNNGWNWKSLDAADSLKYVQFPLE